MATRRMNRQHAATAVEELTGDALELAYERQMVYGNLDTSDARRRYISWAMFAIHELCRIAQTTEHWERIEKIIKLMQPVVERYKALQNPCGR